jgi:hypothetical protein
MEDLKIYVETQIINKDISIGINNIKEIKNVYLPIIEININVPKEIESITMPNNILLVSFPIKIETPKNQLLDFILILPMRMNTNNSKWNYSIGDLDKILKNNTLLNYDTMIDFSVEISALKMDLIFPMNDIRSGKLNEKKICIEHKQDINLTIKFPKKYEITKTTNQMSVTIDVIMKTNKSENLKVVLNPNVKLITNESEILTLNLLEKVKLVKNQKNINIEQDLKMIKINKQCKNLLEKTDGKVCLEIKNNMKFEDIEKILIWRYIENINFTYDEFDIIWNTINMKMINMMSSKYYSDKHILKRFLKQLEVNDIDKSMLDTQYFNDFNYIDIYNKNNYDLKWLWNGILRIFIKIIGKDYFISSENILIIQLIMDIYRNMEDIVKKVIQNKIT